jgi:hypothetical protein
MSILSDTLAPVLSIWSHVLNYFVAGNELTVQGNVLAGSITDIVRGIADFSSYLYLLLY